MTKRHRTISLGLLVLALFLAACRLGSEVSSGIENSATQPINSNEGFDQSNSDQHPEIKPDWQIASGPQAVSAGDLQEDGLQVQIPGGSFDQETSLDIYRVVEHPDVPAAEMALSQAVDVSAGSPVRLNEATTITFLVNDPADREAMAEGSLWAAYYNGEEWEYYYPQQVDLEAGTLTIATYHFSLQGYGQISVEERLNQYVHSQAISSFVQSNVVDEKVNQIVSQTLDHLLKEQLKLGDDSLKAKIISSLVNDDAWGNMVQQMRDGNVTEFVKTLNVFAGQKIVENVDESLLASTLETLSGDSAVGFTESAAQAAAYLVEGQPKQAARILGEKIADQFLVTTLAKGAVEIIQHEIDVWKDAEIEAAFKAYKNGADGYFWGYNVDPLQFDDLYSQMRGIAVRLEQEAVQREIERREESQMRPASDQDLEAIREQVKTGLKKQFDQRIQQEEQLAEREQQIKTLIDKMREANLLEKHSFGFDPTYDTLETRLDKLFHLANKILRDTGRGGWTSGALSTDKALSAEQMAILMQTYFVGGHEEYNAKIFDLYGIRLLPACRWEHVETKEYLSDGSGHFVVSYDGGNQVTISYPMEAGSSCGALTFNSFHSWSEPPGTLIPGDVVSSSVSTSWALDGDPACSGLTAGLKTSLQIWDFVLSAGKNSIPTSAEPQGSVSAEGDWIVPQGNPGNRLEIIAFPDGGGGGGTIRYYYDFICVQN